MKIKQKIIALLGVILVLSLSILPIVTSADVIGDSGLTTGWYLDGTLTLYDSGPDITTDWGGNDPWFPVVDQFDNYTNISRSGDLMTYSDYSVGADTVSYSLYPKFNNSIVNMMIGDSLTFSVTGSFSDITNGDEWPYLRISFNRSAYIIKSYYLTFSYYNENILDYEFYEEIRPNWYRSDFEFDVAWSEIQGFYLELEIITQTSLPGNLRILIDHSVRELPPDVDDSSYWLGFYEGRAQGRAEGMTQGFREGYDQGKADANVDIEARLARAKADGIQEGRKQAYDEMSGQNGRYTSWLITAVGGFLDFEIFPGFTLAGIMGILVGIFVVIAFLRYYSGG